MSKASDLVFDVRELGRNIGSTQTFSERISAPGLLENPVIGVPEGAPMNLSLRLEAIHEGILATGTAQMIVRGECSRCLDPLKFGLEVTFQELFVFRPDEAEEQPEVVDDTIDVESHLRDAIVTALPFQPVCTEDCQGLCPQCGIRMEAEPGHHHETVDTRWSALQGLFPDQGAQREKS